MATIVDEQARWESGSGADVDNFAKLLNDAIVGPRGLLIDDCQVQHLAISWLPAHGPAYFDLTIRSHPDEWIDRRLKLYEMCNGQWHPFNAIDDPDASAMVLYAIDSMVRRVWRVRHHLRLLGVDSMRAFQLTAPLAPISRGFHTTRARTGGFPMIPHKEWTAWTPPPEPLARAREEDFKLLARIMLSFNT